VYVLSIAAADDLTQRDLQQYPYIVRTSWTSSQPHHPLGKWACENGFKRVVTVGADYAFGHEVVGGFQKAFEDCGGKVVQKIWPPLGTKDFGPYIPTIRKDADAIFTVMVGPMALQFPKQAQAAGIKTPIIGGGTSYDEYGKVPSYYSESNYTTAQMIDEVMKRNKGKWPGPQQFIKQLQGLKLEAVRGPVYFDDMRNPVQNIYIKKVEKKKMFGYPNEELWNTIIKTYPDVGQFWKYGKETFLKQPVYSRDFPPCKYCE
jgi:branched-chain amino acid transport system substrate-binding protein